jgi:hypothetical protein
MGVGLGLLYAGVQTAANAGVPEDQAGLAAALITTSFQLGSALGLAVFSGIATSRTSHLLAAHTPPPDALTAGFQRGLLVSALCLVAAGAIALRASNTRGEPAALPGLQQNLEPSYDPAQPDARGVRRCRATRPRRTSHFRRVVADHDTGIRDDERSGRVAPLALPGVADEPAIQRLVPGLELRGVVARGVESLGGCPQRAHLLARLKFRLFAGGLWWMAGSVTGPRETVGIGRR